MSESFIRLPVDGSGKSVRTYTKNVLGSDFHHQAFVLCNEFGDVVGTLNANPAGTEWGLVTRNIPSGTQAVSVSSLPLPSGASSESTLSSVKTNLDTLILALDTVEAKLQAISDNTDSLEVNTDELEARIGDLTASPAVTSVIGRLKAAQASLTSIDSKDFATSAKQDSTKAVLDNILLAVDGLEGFTDGIEALLTSISSSVDGLEGYTDGIEGILTTIAASAVAIDANTDTIEALLSSLSTPSTYAEDSTHVSGDAGTFILGVRNDTGAALTSNNGDYSPIATDLAGRPRIIIDTSVLPTGAATEASLVSVLSSVDGIETLLTAISASVADLDGNTDGIESLLTAIAASVADLDGNTDGIEALLTTIAGYLAAPGANYDEDSPHADGDSGTFVMGVRNDASDPLTDADGDYSPIAVDEAGRPKVVVESSALPTGAATEATQTAVKADLDTLILALDTVETKLQSIIDNTDTIEVSLGDIDVNTDELEARIGDLTGSPAVNSVIGRLKTAQASLTSIDSKDFSTAAKQDLAKAVLDSILLATDGIEGLLTTLNAKDFSTAAKQDLVKAVLDNILLAVDGVESLLTTAASVVKLEDSAHSSGDAGTFILGVRNDAAAVRTTTDGDYTPISTDSAGRPKVVVDSSALPTGAATETTLGSVLTSVDGVEALLTTIAAAVADLDGNTDGIEALLTAISSAVADLDGNTDGIEALLLTIAGYLAAPGANYDEDGAHASGDSGTFVMGVRNDASVALTDADGDYSPIAVDSAGRSKVRIDVSALPSGAATEVTLAAAKADLDTLVLALDTVETKLQSVIDNTDELEPRIGDLTGSPAANSLIGRLKAAQVTLSSLDAKDFSTAAKQDLAKAVLDNILLAVDGLEGFTDGLEGLLTNLNAKDFATSAKQDLAKAVLDNILLAVDGVETLLTTVASTVKLEDAAHVSGDAGTFILGVRNDAAAVRTTTDGDYTPISTDSAGRPKVIVDTSVLPTGAATETTLAAAKADLDTLIIALDTVETKLQSIMDNTDEVEARLGDLTGSPAANSIIGRLKAAQVTLTSLDGKDYATSAKQDLAKAVLDNILLATDGVEGLITTLNAKDFATSAKQDLAKAVLDNILLSVEGIEALLTTANGTLKAEDSAHVSGDVGTFVLGVRNDAAAALTTTDGDYSPLATDLAGRVKAITSGSADAGNTSVANLAAAAVFTGTWTEVLNVTEITIGIATSHASATDGLTLQWSDDGTNIRDTDSYTIGANANDGQAFSFGPKWRYYRVVYTNGGTLTTTLAIQAIFKYGHSRSSTHRIGDAITSEQDSELVKTVNVLLTTPPAPFNISVGTSSVQLTSTVSQFGVLVQALSTNTGIVYVGTTTGVTTGTGIELYGGDWIVYEVDNASDLWCIASAASQNVRVQAI